VAAVAQVLVDDPVQETRSSLVGKVLGEHLLAVLERNGGGDADALELISSGANFTTVVDQVRWIIWCAYAVTDRGIQYFINFQPQNSFPKILRQDGNTALLVAAKHRRNVVAARLLSLGANVHETNKVRHL
jgi:hypothetical protein